MSISFRNILFYLTLVFIILFSFFQFSYRFTSALNSDMAINILMTPGYTLPADLYAWGQDRGGSLIPLLAHFVNKFSHISPISSVSVVHYFILILGFLCAMPLFNSRRSKLLLALVWFLPPWHLIDFVYFPFGTQISLMFIGIWFLKKLQEEKRITLQILWLSFSFVLFILTIWVSDLGLLSLLLFAPFVFYEWFIKIKKENDWKWLIRNLLVFAIWSISGTLFLLYGKAHATKINEYSNHPFNNWNDLLASIKIMFNTLYKIFIFRSENNLEGVYAWFLLMGISVIKWFSLFRNKGWWAKINKKWFVFFTLHGVILFMVMALSHWVLLNGVGRRYFVLVYLSFAIVILLMTETTDGKIRKYLNIILTLIVFTGFVSSFYKFYIPKHKPPTVKILSELQTLGDIGLIGEYWNAYVSATPDPVRIKATAHDKDYVRNYQLTEEVFAQPKIYIIKDSWLKSFPDTMQQFGRTLVRSGDSLYLGGSWINRYEIVFPVH